MGRALGIYVLDFAPSWSCETVDISKMMPQGVGTSPLYRECNSDDISRLFLAFLAEFPGVFSQ